MSSAARPTVLDLNCKKVHGFEVMNDQLYCTYAPFGAGNINLTSFPAPPASFIRLLVANRIKRGLGTLPRAWICIHKFNNVFIQDPTCTVDCR